MSVCDRRPPGPVMAVWLVVDERFFAKEQVCPGTGRQHEGVLCVYIKNDAC